MQLQKTQSAYYIKLVLSCLFFLVPFAHNYSAWADNKASVVINVDGNAITNYDIEHRIALLKLQHRSGDLEKIAKNELIDETLKRLEAHRQNLVISDDQVEAAYAHFSQQNGMPPEEFSMLLNNIGVTSQHFRDYLRAQIEWGRVLSQRFQKERSQKGGLISQEETIQRMLQNNGTKPQVTEYKLKQIVLIVPYKSGSTTISQRMNDAKKIRAKVSGCDSIKKAIHGFLDVSIHDLGRILEPQLPLGWEKPVKHTAIGKVTPPVRTERGVEMLAICETRKVSNDNVAQLIFSIKNNQKNGFKEMQELDKKYLKELHKTARIKYF